VENWAVLEIEPTTDKRAVKKAYAKKLKKTNPEENPDEFKTLRAAYEILLNRIDNDILYESQLEEDDVISPEVISADFTEQPSEEETEQNFQPDTDVAYDFFTHIMQQLNTNGEEAALLALDEVLHSSELINIDISDEFEARICQATYDFSEDYWPSLFVKGLVDQLEMRLRANTDSRFLDLLSYIDYRDEEVESTIKKAAQTEREKMHDSCIDWVETTKNTLLYRGDEEAYQYLSALLEEKQFKEEELFAMFTHEIVTSLEDFAPREWPRKLMGLIIKRFKLSPEHRDESQYKHYIDYLSQRTKTASFYYNLKNEWQSLTDGSRKHVLDLLFAPKQNKDNLKLNLRERMILRSIVKSINREDISLWNYEFLESVESDLFTNTYLTSEKNMRPLTTEKASNIFKSSIKEIIILYIIATSGSISIISEYDELTFSSISTIIYVYLGLGLFIYLFSSFHCFWNNSIRSEVLYYREYLSKKKKRIFFINISYSSLLLSTFIIDTTFNNEIISSAYFSIALLVGIIPFRKNYIFSLIGTALAVQVFVGLPLSDNSSLSVIQAIAINTALALTLSQLLIQVRNLFPLKEKLHIGNVGVGHWSSVASTQIVLFLCFIFFILVKT